MAGLLFGRGSTWPWCGYRARHWLAAASPAVDWPSDRLGWRVADRPLFDGLAACCLGGISFGPRRDRAGLTASGMPSVIVPPGSMSRPELLVDQAAAAGPAAIIRRGPHGHAWSRTGRMRGHFDVALEVQVVIVWAGSLCMPGPAGRHLAADPRRRRTRGVTRINSSISLIFFAHCGGTARRDTAGRPTTGRPLLRVSTRVWTRPAKGQRLAGLHFDGGIDLTHSSSAGTVDAVDA